MGDGPVGDSNDGAEGPWAALLDPVANARALGDVQAQALRAAGELVERLVRSADGRRPAPDQPGERHESDGAGDPANGSAAAADPANGSAAAGGETARLMGVWIDLLQRTADSFRPATRSGDPGRGRVEVDLRAGASGGLLHLDLDSAAAAAGAAEIWLHNGTGAPSGPLRLHGGELSSADGGVLERSLVFEPGEIQSLPARSSRGVVVSIAGDAELHNGTYRGLIQVAGVPDVWLAAEVVVGEVAQQS